MFIKSYYPCTELYEWQLNYKQKSDNRYEPPSKSLKSDNYELKQKVDVMIKSLESKKNQMKTMQAKIDVRSSNDNRDLQHIHFKYIE